MKRLTDEQIRENYYFSKSYISWNLQTAVENVIKAQLDQDRKDAQAIFKVYDEYLKLYDIELGELMGIVVVHGWKSTRVEQGKKLRAKIRALKRYL